MNIIQIRRKWLGISLPCTGTLYTEADGRFQPEVFSMRNTYFAGWWGAWLDSRPDKMVLAPATWFRNEQRDDILPSNWIPISVEK